VAGVETHRLGRESRAAALSFLARDPRANLFLLDLATRLGAPPAPGEPRTEMVGAWRGDELVAVAALRPSVALTPAPPDAIEAFLPYLESLGVGLVKSPSEAVDALWHYLRRVRRRHVLLDRLETAYALRESEARLVDVRPHERVRAADLGDLEPLVVAARESLREEDRPDPFAGDIRGFRRWVRGRIPRARVVESGGRIVCVGYADVRLREGWLIQGVYCWPDVRRQRFATTGVSDLCREAFAAGAEHVQLAVVDGNEAGRRLYEGLGFEPFAKLRTILFT
jgi:RimJ/RimL family protein N-acetyltransferase